MISLYSHEICSSPKVDFLFLLPLGSPISALSGAPQGVVQEVLQDG
jgi:hypothetical protein